jgi:hypothetical protein
VTISGIVNANGTLNTGKVVTVSHPKTGFYLLNFPAGTWPSFPVVVVTLFGTTGGAAPEVDSITAPGNGSATVLVVVTTPGYLTPTDAPFTFVATAT